MYIDELSEIFMEFKVYPLCSYSKNTPVRVFQNLYSEDYFSKDINRFLDLHDYKPVRRGADLPWWGKSFFENNNHKRVMIVSQNSLSGDAGSIVFWANLYDVINNKEEYEIYNSLLNNDKLFAYSSWYKVFKKFLDWKINLDYCYITDASKVYKLGSSRDRDFDDIKSRELLHNEIKICQPDLIILLGSQPLKLIFPETKYSDVIENEEYLYFNGIKVVVSPFITGQGHTQRNYMKRLNIATELINQEL